MRRSLVTALVLSALLAFAPRSLARAGEEDEQKRKEKEWKKLEEKQKKGGEKPGKGDEGHGAEGDKPEGGIDGLGDNPLGKILDLMKEVEGRLNDTDAGEFTQEDQRKIIEAMKFEGKAKAALDDLIKKIEDMQEQQSQQSQSQDQSEQQKKQQQKSEQDKQRQNETPEQRKEREKKEREKQEREKKEEEKRQRQNPQNQQKKPQDQQQKDKQRRDQAGKKPPEDSQSPLNPAAQDARPWGNLPPKLHGDADKAKQAPVPERWRDQIERYREGMSGE